MHCLATSSRRFVSVLTIAVAYLVAATAYSQVHVRGYHRKDGTYVRPHYRSSPDGDFSNNWSTAGNVNPYTGARGTRTTPPPGYGDGYIRFNGTTFTTQENPLPNGIYYNSLSASEITNPYAASPSRSATVFKTSVAEDEQQVSRPPQPSRRESIEEMIGRLEQTDGAQRLRVASEMSKFEPAVLWLDLAMRMNIAETISTSGHNPDWQQYSSLAAILDVLNRTETSKEQPTEVMDDAQDGS
jgi:hypothetical protein